MVPRVQDYSTQGLTGGKIPSITFEGSMSYERLHFQGWAIVSHIRDSGTQLLTGGKYLLLTLKIPRVIGGDTFRDGQWYPTSYYEKCFFYQISRYYELWEVVPSGMGSGTLHSGWWYHLLIWGGYLL